MQSRVRSLLSFNNAPGYQPTPTCRYPEIEFESLNASYSGRLILKNVNLTVTGGEITALIGPSGCGKSTLLNVVNRLIALNTDCHITGDVKISGRSIFDPSWNPQKLRQQVGILFQKPNPFPISIRENILFPLREHGIKEGLENILESVLTEVGLWEEVKNRLNDSALMLSGGQQQRLCLARTIALKPEVLLLDEPCSALDPVSSEVVESLIKKFRDKYTVLMVTHNLSQARRVAQSVAMCWSVNGCGCIVEHGETSQIFRNPSDDITRQYVYGNIG